MDLPSTQTTFEFDFTSELGKRYDGSFTVLCVLDMKTKHRLELEKTRMLGNSANPTDELAGLAIVLSNLRIRIIDGPNWWKQSDGGYNITEFDTLTSLYEKVLSAEAEWRLALKEKAKKLQEKTVATEAATTSP